MIALSLRHCVDFNYFATTCFTTTFWLIINIAILCFYILTNEWDLKWIKVIIMKLRMKPVVTQELCVTVSAAGCGFNSHSRKWKMIYFTFSFHQSVALSSLSRGLACSVREGERWGGEIWRKLGNYFSITYKQRFFPLHRARCISVFVYCNKFFDSLASKANKAKL